jgi:hypothetical protein
MRLVHLLLRQGNRCQFGFPQNPSAFRVAVARRLDPRSPRGKSSPTVALKPKSGRVLDEDVAQSAGGGAGGRA